MVEWTAYAKGIAFAAPGAGAVYLGVTKVPSKWKPYVIGGGVILIGLGAWYIYKETREGEPPDYTDDPISKPTIPVEILDPEEGEDWSVTIPHRANVRAVNPTNERKTFWVGFSMIDLQTGKVYDFDPKKITLDPGEEDYMGWFMYGTPNGERGDWKAIASSWNISPYEGCEPKCYRCGYDEVNFTFSWIG